MNNKIIGTDFEHRVCDMFSKLGYWVHFIVPDSRGAQPFDVIAVKNGRALAIDCKTCVAKRFNISRLEDNQILAFEKWISCGNEMPLIAIEHDGNITFVRYDVLKAERSIKLGDSKWETTL